MDIIQFKYFRVQSGYSIVHFQQTNPIRSWTLAVAIIDTCIG